MQKIRVKFAKEGRAKYISHLDMNRCMQRSFKRSRLPIKYTEGFNPHAYIMFPLALSLGFESESEFMDFSLTEDIPPQTVAQRLNDALPEGIRVLEAGEPLRKHTDISAARYEVLVCGADCADFERFISQEIIEVEKRTKKKGVSVIDIKPDFTVLSACNTAAGLELTLLAPAGTVKNLNPTLLTDAFAQFCGVPFDVKIRRNAIICADGKDFF